MVDTYKFSIKVSAIARRILKDYDHSALIVKFSHDFAMLAGKTRIKDMDVIVRDTTHCENLVQNLNTLYLSSDTVEFRPNFTRDCLLVILNFLWVDFPKFHLCSISQFLV
jgi:hypothetical protein